MANIHTAMKAAKDNDWLLTLGIKPSRPDTGYGYIQFKDDDVDGENDHLKKSKNLY